VKKLIVLAVLLATAVPASATTTRILAPMDWWPVWSPDGSHVAFTRVYSNHMELWTLDVRTHRIVQVGAGAGQLGPTWSHDGARLAYSSGGLLYAADADGTRKARLVAPGKAYAPAWRPTGNEFAYVTTAGAKNLDLWVGNSLWARNAIGSPAWSPDGTQLAFQRDDGLYVTSSPGAGRRLVAVDNPGAPTWSTDGKRVAYIARGSIFVVDLSGGASSLKVKFVATGIRVPSWSLDGARLSGDRTWSPVADTYVQPGPRPGCPGHTVLLAKGGEAVTGSCLVVGTPKADTIEGTPLQGDVIQGLAGSDQIHANDGHTDTVNCGPGRDTVWADRTDRLTACEIVHR
jgi:dipeptidyl aminopeptidase/acylaminoacyl peptidase